MSTETDKPQRLPWRRPHRDIEGEMIISLTRLQRSALECSGLGLAWEPDDLVLAEAWDQKDGLAVSPETADAIVRALTAQANSEDEGARRGVLGARAACTALTSLAAKVRESAIRRTP